MLCCVECYIANVADAMMLKMFDFFSVNAMDALHKCFVCPPLSKGEMEPMSMCA